MSPSKGVGTPTPPSTPVLLQQVLAEDEDLLALTEQAHRLTQESEK